MILSMKKCCNIVPETTRSCRNITWRPIFAYVIVNALYLFYSPGSVLIPPPFKNKLIQKPIEIDFSYLTP